MKTEKVSLVAELVQCIGQDNRVVSLTGGGGKTTVMVALASYLKKCGYSVLLSTTTSIPSQTLFDYGADVVLTNESDFFTYEPHKGDVVLYAEKHVMDYKRFYSPREEILPFLSKKYDYLLLIADVSKNLPLVKHREEYPRIASFSKAVIAVVGMSCFGKLSDDMCLGEDHKEKVDEIYLQSLFDNAQGCLKGLESCNHAVVLLNQCDVLQEEQLAQVKRVKSSYKIVYGSVEQDCMY